MTKEELLDVLKQKKIRHIRLQFLDLNGNIKSVMVPIASVEVVLNNQITYLGLSTDGMTKIKETELYLVPDLTTFQELDFKNVHIFGAGNLFCDTKLESGEYVSKFPRTEFIANQPADDNNILKYDTIRGGDNND